MNTDLRSALHSLTDRLEVTADPFPTTGKQWAYSYLHNKMGSGYASVEIITPGSVIPSERSEKYTLPLSDIEAAVIKVALQDYVLKAAASNNPCAKVGCSLLSKLSTETKDRT